MTLSITSCRPGRPCSSLSPGLATCRYQGELIIIETRGSGATSQSCYSFLLSVFLKLILVPWYINTIRLLQRQNKMSDSHWFRRNVVTVSLCYSGNSVGVTILLHLVGIPRSQEPKKIWDSLICLIFIKFFERSNQIYWEDLSIWERARLALRANK